MHPRLRLRRCQWRLVKLLLLWPDAKAPLPSIYTTPTLASAKVGVGVEGGEAPITLVDAGDSLAFTDTILTLASTGVGAEAGTISARETEGTQLGLRTDSSVAGETSTVSMGSRDEEIYDRAV